ncbi:MAG: tRNA (adenosine(37)-N6)-dimethylallyltransferase MiaA [Clostridia bacterium]|nr:tRNA (adenosine(37)-N6)-dimethylallyltransferase MiaA [Clostridia bacterium]
MKKIVIVGGPTASGKSELALRLCSRFGGELISADSMQIYKRLDIGTAKPSLEERALVPHHLIDIREPWENYSVSDFTRDCAEAIEDVTGRGRLPVVCGGTGLYIDALIRPTEYSEQAGADPSVREKLMEEDAHVLWLRLEKIDPQAAASIHENNKKRVVRALEIYQATGKTKTENDRLQRKAEPVCDALLLLTGFCEREILYGRINRRVDKMVEAGLVEETRGLLEDGDLRPGTTAYQAIGYKEFFPYINGEKTLDECVEKLKQATRNYAKRQLTWFSRYDGVKVPDHAAAEAAVEDFLKGGDSHGQRST